VLIRDQLPDPRPIREGRQRAGSRESEGRRKGARSRWFNTWETNPQEIVIPPHRVPFRRRARGREKLAKNNSLSLTLSLSLSFFLNS